MLKGRGGESGRCAAAWRDLGALGSAAFFELLAAAAGAGIVSAGGGVGGGIGGGAGEVAHDQCRGLGGRGGRRSIFFIAGSVWVKKRL